MVEEVVEPSRPAANSRSASRSSYALRTQAQRLTEINTQEMPRLLVPIGECNRVLGGGIVPGSIVLIGGEPGIGKCVTGNTLIPTDQGLLPLEQLKPEIASEGFSPLTIGVQSSDGLRQTSHFYDSGVQPTRRIQTRMGYGLQGTYTHPVLVLAPGGMKCWKNLEAVQPGDYVAIQRHGAVWGNQTDLPSYAFNRHGNSIVPELPTHLDTELSYILGLLVGDGCLTGGGIQLTTNDSPIITAIERWAVSIGVHMYISTKQNTTAVNCRISNRILLRWLEQIGVSMATAHDKQVPTCILRSRAENVRAFLQGLFDTDGSAGRLFVEYCTVSEQLARQVHLLLLQFGIVAKLRFRPNAYKGAWVIYMQGDNARLFYARIGFRLERKQRQLDRLPVTSNSNLDVIPYLPELDITRLSGRRGQVGMRRRIFKRYLRGGRKISYTAARSYIDVYPELTDYIEPGSTCKWPR
jgi:hypothetical protein